MNRTTVATCTALLVGGFGAGAALHGWLSDRCAPPGEADQARLASVVRVQYKLPPTSRIGVADGGVADGSCFRKLVFATLSGAPFRTELFLSPDFRYLTDKLMDARPDPKADVERRRQTAESLVRGNPPVRGVVNAPVTIAVFSDFQCPYCARMPKVLDELSASEGDKMRVVYRYFPLSMHPWARLAAEAAACAQRQGDATFWTLHDFFFAHQTELSRDNLLKRIAQWEDTAMIDRGQFEKCVSGSLTSGQIEQDIALGKELGVGGTPTVFLNGEPVDERSTEALRALIRRAAAGRSSSSVPAS